MASKLSVHLTDPGNRTGYGEFLRIPAEAGKPVVMVYQLNANTKTDIDRYSPTTKLVYRRQSAAWQRLPNDLYQVSPVISCDNWMLNTTENGRNLMQMWALNPADYYDPLNEPVISNIGQADWLNTWMIRALNIANDYGFKLAMYSFSVGSPDYQFWPFLYPSLELGKQLGAILSLHEYGVTADLIIRNPDGSLSDQTLNLGLRHRKIYNSLPSVCKVPIIISEASRGSGYDGTPEFLLDAIEYDKEIMKDTYVLAANLFQLGGSESNLQPHLLELTDYIANSPDPIPEPEPEPEPLPYIVTVYLGPQSATLDQMKLIQTDAFNTRSTVCQSADDARYLVRAGQSGSKVIVYDPQTYPGGEDGVLAFFSGILVEFRYLTHPEFKLQSPILDIPFRVTSKFNDPRPYANGKHEGLDLDCYDDIKRVSVPIYAAQKGKVIKVVNELPVVKYGYGRHVVIEHEWYGQIYRTWYCHLWDIYVSNGQEVEIGDKIGLGGNSGTNAIHLHLNLQKIPGGLSGYYIPDVVDPLPYIIVPEPPSETKPGLHMAARGGDQTNDDWEAFDLAKLKSIKFLSNHALNDIYLGTSKVGPENVYFRMYADPNDPIMSSGISFFEVHRGWFDQLYSANILNWEIHNEPNLQSEGLGRWWINAEGFKYWYLDCARLIRTNYPKARIGFPGLSPQPNVPEFISILDQLIQEGYVDWIGAHSYWQTWGNTGWGIDSPDGGRYYRRFLNKGRPVILTEASNNGSASPDEKGEQYVYYIKTIDPQVRAILFFVSSSDSYLSENWVGTNIPKIVGSR